MEPIKVAIADANTLLREGLKRVLGLESDLLVVGEAMNDAEVAEIVARAKPDVLLLDLEIATRKAVPTLLDLKRKNVATKVFILSLFPDQESILDTAKAGARGFGLKSILPSTLIQAIRRIHGGEIWVDRQLNCAETFLEFARQAGADEAGGTESEIATVLSKRELEILALVAKGLSNQEISKTLFISLRTVKAHVNHILNKLGVKNRLHATLLFLRHYQNDVKYGKRGAGGSPDGSISEQSGLIPRRRRAS